MMVISVALAMAMAGTVQTGPSAAPAPDGQSLQQRFDAASADELAGKCEQAVAEFESLEKTPAAQKNRLVRAAIATRKGWCLWSLDRADDAERSISAGLPELEQAGPSFVPDVARSKLILAKAAMARLDYLTAQSLLEPLLATQTGGARLPVLGLLAQVTAFDPGPQPLAYADEALRIASADPKASKDMLAMFHTLHARVLLNQGKNEDAYAELKDALKQQGGLTTRSVSHLDVATRGDLALAALLSGDEAAARKFLAYTGAGHIAESPFTTAREMQAPLCGAQAGLGVDDFAVVEFSLAPDGSVRTAIPIYSTGGRKVALAFADAVRGWSWTPESIAKIPQFYRSATRVELRCSRTLEDRAGLLHPMRERFADWLASQGALPAETDRGEALAVTRARAQLQDAKAHGDQARELGLALQLAFSPLVPRDESQVMADRAVELTRLLNAPPAAANLALIVQRNLAPQRGQQAIRKLLDDPRIAADPLARATVESMVAAAAKKAKRREEESTFLDAVIATPELPPHHPLKVSALLERATLAANAGDFLAAEASFKQTGLSEQQCSLIGLRPAVRRTNVSSSDYPVEAQQLGFEGWVRLEFDVQADGATANQRPIIAYPPFVFVKAATDISKHIRYESSYRPSGGTACSANQKGISFIRP